MTNPLRIPLSSFQRDRIIAFEREIARAQARKDDAITAIVAGQVDPSTLGDWKINLSDTEIVLTPPEEKKP